MQSNLPYTRFRGCGKHSPALTVGEVLDWLKTHSFIWYEAPMNNLTAVLWMSRGHDNIEKRLDVIESDLKQFYKELAL